MELAAEDKELKIPLYFSIIEGSLDHLEKKIGELTARLSKISSTLYVNSPEVERTSEKNAEKNLSPLGEDLERIDYRVSELGSRIAQIINNLEL